MAADVTCVILAGGQSRRMGQDKAFIQVAGVRLFDYVYGKCRKFFSRVVIVTNRPEQFHDYPAHVVTDEITVTASLGGLYTGLLRAETDYVFCLACDMPFLQPPFIRYLLSLRFDYDVVIPRTSEGLEPLHAVYSKKCINPIKRLLDAGQFQITKFLSEVRVRYCETKEIQRYDPSLSSFVNINTKADLRRIQAKLQGDRWEKLLEAS